MSGDIHTPLPDYAHEDFRYLLRLLSAVLSTDDGWRDGLKETVDGRTWPLWSCYDGAVRYYLEGRGRVSDSSDARLLPEYVVSWTSRLSSASVELVGETVASTITPCTGDPMNVGRRWVEETSRTALRLHFLLSSDHFD